MFNIGAVSRMTNVLEATLRVWERRYKFPQATRTKGGHRLYTQQDVLRLQWVKTRIDEGMQVSHAIRALQRAEQDGTFMPTITMPTTSMPTTSMPATSTMAERSPQEGTTIDQLQKRLLDALLTHDIESANWAIGEAQTLYPLEEIILSIIGPTMNAIGMAWEQGEIDVATEHLATNHLRHLLLVWMRVGPPAYNVNPVLLACAPGELHEGSLLMLGVLLRRLRWPVLYLGQTMPLPALPMFIEDLSPSIIVFVAMLDEQAQALAQWPEWLPEVAESGHPLLSFGGRAFVENPELVDKVQGLYLGDHLQEGIQKLNSTLHKLNPLL